MAKKKAGNAALWVIILLLIVGLAGFGATNFGGSVRSVATVGEVEVSTNDYARAVENQLRTFQQTTGQPITFQQGRALGIDRTALSQLVAAAALENAAAEMGLSAGDAAVAQEIADSPAFQGAGGFDRGLYQTALRQSGTTVPEFEAQVRADIASSLLRSAVGTGVTTPDIYTDTLYNWVRENRDITWARLTADDLREPLPEPSEADLQAYYEANTDTFTRPETKSIRYAWLTPDMIVDDIEVDDAQLQTLYDARRDEYVQPERRLVERLVFASEAAAAEARAAIDANETDFDALVTERGLSLSDVDLGDVSRDDLGAAADGVFALEEPGIAGPLPSTLGPALFRMNGILSATETTFEEAREELAAEAAADRARRIIVDAIPQVEDLLAGGADMDLLAERTDMEAGAIEWNEDVFEGIAAYDAFRSAAAAAQPGDFAEVVELDDGGIVALTVSAVTPPEPIPFEEVRDEVIEGWEQSETEAALTARAEDLVAEARSGADMALFGLDLQTETDLSRDSFLDGTPPGFIETVFSMDIGGFRILRADGDAWIVRLDAVMPPDPTTDEAKALREDFARRTAVDLSTGLIRAYTQAVLDATSVDLNQTALNAVNAQLP